MRELPELGNRSTASATTRRTRRRASTSNRTHHDAGLVNAIRIDSRRVGHSRDANH